MRVHGRGERDGLEMSLLLDFEIIPAAARCRDEALRRAMSALLIHVEACDTVENRSTHETRLRTLLHEMAADPPDEFVLRVTATSFRAEPASEQHDHGFQTAEAETESEAGRDREWRYRMM